MPPLASWAAKTASDFSKPAHKCWSQEGLTYEMQAATLACAIKYPYRFPEFWEFGYVLFDSHGISFISAAKKLLALHQTLTLTAVHNGVIKRLNRGDDSDEAKREALDELAAAIKAVDVDKELPFVVENLAGWMRHARHEVALKNYGQTLLDCRSRNGDEDNDADVTAAREEVIAAVQAMCQPIQSGNNNPISVCNIDDIINDDGKPPDWLFEELFPATGVATISGRAKSQKSWLAIDLCTSVSAGVDWLKFQTRPAKAVYVNFELSEKTLRNRIKHIMGAKHIDPQKLKGKLLPITIRTGGLFARIRNEDKLKRETFTTMVMQQVRAGLAMAEMKDPGVIVLDSFYNLVGKLNENDAGDVTIIYALARELADEFGCLVVIIHHFAKGSPGEKFSGDRAAGSRVHRQAPNAYIELIPHKEDGALVFSAELRDYKAVPSFCLRWEFPLLVLAPELDVTDLKRTPRGNSHQKKYDVKDILLTLEDGPLTTGEWCSACKDKFEMSPSAFYRLRKQIEESNTKLVIQKGKKWALSSVTESKPVEKPKSS